jgi:hypothetical protein
MHNGRSPAVIDAAAGLERIELAERHSPVCWCGAPTLAVERRGVIRLACSSLRQPQSSLGRLLTLAAGHTDQAILDLSDFALTA